jgi:hypothetical protein
LKKRKLLLIEDTAKDALALFLSELGLEVVQIRASLVVTPADWKNLHPKLELPERFLYDSDETYAAVCEEVVNPKK